MSNKIRKCVVCGTEFKFCPHSCRDAKPRWKYIYCGDNCHDIFNIITNVYDMQGVGAAAEQLLDCDLSNMGNFRDDVKAKIERIFDEADLSFEVESVDENDDTTDIEDSTFEETMDDLDSEDEFENSEDDETDFMSESVDE